MSMFRHFNSVFLTSKSVFLGKFKKLNNLIGTIIKNKIINFIPDCHENIISIKSSLSTQS